MNERIIKIMKNVKAISAMIVVCSIIIMLFSGCGENNQSASMDAETIAQLSETVAALNEQLNALKAEAEEKEQNIAAPEIEADAETSIEEEEVTEYTSMEDSIEEEEEEDFTFGPDEGENIIQTIMSSDEYSGGWFYSEEIDTLLFKIAFGAMYNTKVYWYQIMNAISDDWDMSFDGYTDDGRLIFTMYGSYSYREDVTYNDNSEPLGGNSFYIEFLAEKNGGLYTWTESDCWFNYTKYAPRQALYDGYRYYIGEKEFVHCPNVY